MGNRIIAYTNGGTFAAETEFTSGTLATPTKDGYTFGGWYSDSNFSTAATTPAAGQTYYAKWVSKITFDANGGAGSMDAQEITEGDTATALTANSFTKTGYTFSGWNTAADGTGTSYTNKATGAGENGSTTLYAQWTPNTYTINFNAGTGAGGSTTSVTATYDQPATLTANGFTKSGYNFAGWSKTENGTTVDFSDGAQVKNLTESANGTVTLYAVWTNKEVLAPDVSTQTKTYSGTEHSFTLDGSYTISYQQDGQAATPKNAGTYDVVISSEETESTAAYKNTVYGGLVIDPAPLTITADNQTIYVGGSLPEYTYTVSGLVGEDKLTTAPTVTCSDADANTAGTYTITASGADAGNNYTITYVNGTLTVSRRSSGGGGGSSSSSNTTTETVTNKDGSTTTTVTDKKTGTVTETTKYKDGSTLVVVTEKDGTVTTTETAANGVKVKTVDEPGEDTTATVTIPRSVGEAAVTIPAEVDYGMVAVDAETGEIVKLSVPTADGMLVKLDGSANLVLEDRSKNFTDTNNHWAEDAIDFATAHGMFSGTSATTFSPDGTMTRGMIAVVLHNFDDNPDHAFTGSFEDVHPTSWYADGIHWMVDSGIAGGYGNGRFGAEDKITREQLATFLYNFAKVKGYDVSGRADLGRFTDGSSVSGYATETMSWAVDSGLFGGMGDGTLAPQGNATRAQVATILMRFVENLTK